MMASSVNWFTQWFKGGPVAAAPPSSLESIRQFSRINYSPTLVPKLKMDHLELVEMYQALERASQRFHFEEIVPALGAFKRKLDAHLLNENLRFYCYLEQRLDNRDELKVMRDFRREMNAIAREVVGFVRKYRQSGVTSANHRQFTTELQQIGALLIERIEREENDLYSLYAP